MFAALAPLPLRAAIWDGGLSHGDFTLNDLWTTGNNWQDAIPVSSATTDVVFVLSSIRTTATQNLATPFTLRSLTFSSGSNVVAVTGNPLNIAAGGNIAQNSAVSAVVSNAIHWNSTGIVTGTGTAQLALAATMSGNASVKYVGGPGGMMLFVTVSGANTYTGGTLLGDIAGGSSPVDVRLNSNTAPGTGPIQFFNGNTLRGGDGARSFANPLSLLTTLNGLGNTFTFGNGDDLTFKGAIDVANSAKTLRVENGVTTFDGNMTGAAPLTKGGPGTLVLNGANSGFLGQWTVSGGSVKLGSATALPTTAVTVNPASGLDTSGQANVTITALNGTGDINLGASALTVGSGNFSGAFAGKLVAASINEGPFKKTGSGSFTMTGGLSFLKSITVENGTMNLDGARAVLGFGVNVGGTTATAAMNLSNNGLLTCGSSAGSVISGPPGTNLTMDSGFQWNSGFQVVIGAGFGPGVSTGAVNVRNSATLNGTFMIVGGGGADGIGTLTIENQGLVLSDAGIVGFTGGSAGQVLITGASNWTNNTSLGIGGFNAQQFGGSGTVTVADGAILEVRGPTTFWTAGGKVDVKGGRYLTRSLVTNGLTNATVALSDPDDDHSALTIGGGGANTNFPGAITNSTTGPGGITKLDGGTVTLTGPLSYTGPTRLVGGRFAVMQSYPFATITTVASGSTLEFAGTWGTNTFSQTTIASGGRLIAAGTLKGSVTNSGIVEVSGAKSLTMTGSVVNNGVMRCKSGATFTGTGTLVNNGTIDLITAGSFNPPPGFVNNGRIIDRNSIITSLTKVDTLVTIGSPLLYGGHLYQLQASGSPDTAFAGIGIPFTVNTDQPVSTSLGEIVPQRFYRWKVD